MKGPNFRAATALVNQSKEFWSTAFVRASAASLRYGAALLPDYCLLCAGWESVQAGLCNGCRRDLPWLGRACQRCASALPEGAAPVCGQCQAAPPPFDASYALFRYESPVSDLISAFKYRQSFAAGRTLAALLGQAFSFEDPFLFASGATDGDKAKPPPTDSWLIPVPLHPTRLRQRGFNQAAEFAKALAGPGLKPDLHGCRRELATASQQSLPAALRRRNIQHAFQLNAGARQRWAESSCADSNSGPRLIVIDDVMTTGATVAALASLLKSEGAGRVEVCCIARA